jgi:hypothetical protein
LNDAIGIQHQSRTGSGRVVHVHSDANRRALPTLIGASRPKCPNAKADTIAARGKTVASEGDLSDAHTQVAG